jgi:hypothetical protein
MHIGLSHNSQQIIGFYVRILFVSKITGLKNQLKVHLVLIHVVLVQIFLNSV